MLRIPIDELKPGMVLARSIPVPESPDHVLVARHFKITENLIPKLRKLGIAQVWIRFQGLEFLEGLIDEELQQQQRQVHHTVRRNFQRMMQGVEIDLDYQAFSYCVSELFAYLKESSSSTLMLEKLDTFDNYLMSHTTNVCYLALLLGIKLEAYLVRQRRHAVSEQAKDLQELGLGCLLHDIGKMQISREILDKPEPLTDEEFKEIRRHPEYGYDMVRDHVSAPVAQVVLNHHQRWDGTGYPRHCDSRTGELLEPLAKDRIPVLCRIATAADVYDAATSARVYSVAKLPVRVLHEMRTLCRGTFDPVVEAALFQIVPPFPIASQVKLSTGEEAVVLEHNALEPCQPRVKLLRDPSGSLYPGSRQHEIELSSDAQRDVTHIGECDVRLFLFSPKEAETPVDAWKETATSTDAALVGNKAASAP